MTTNKKLFKLVKKGNGLQSTKKGETKPLMCIDRVSLCEPSKKPAGYCTGCGG